jgi:uncharacterized protein YjbI with pentapeptide repeats
MVQRRTVILLALGATAMASSVVALLVGKQEWDGLLLNFGTEIAGAVVTYGLFELFIGRRERQEEEKARLVAQMGSDEREVAVPAAAELARRGWLYGSLYGANLGGADLSRADLRNADLREADLGWANLGGTTLASASMREALLTKADLREADLVRADLREAVMRATDLCGADLYEADLREAELKWIELREAKLKRADLRGADLRGADLEWADLSEANLEGAGVTEEQLAQAKSLKGAIMPDGTKHD